MTLVGLDVYMDAMFECFYYHFGWHNNNNNNNNKRFFKAKSYKTNNACKLNHELLAFGNRTIARQRDMVGGMVFVGRVLPWSVNSTTRACIRSRLRPVHVFELLAQPGAPILA
jgi:hypothetical protein